MEVSLVLRPANKRKPILRKSQENSMAKELWAEIKAKLETLYKSAKIGEADQKVANAALAELAEAKANLSAESFAALSKTMAEALGFGHTAPGAPPELSEKATATVKSAVTALDAEKPDVDGALSSLAGLVGMTPARKSISDLPPHLKAQFEAMKKASADQATELEKLKKAAEDQAAAATVREFVAKAEALPMVPGEPAKIGSALAILHKADPHAAEIIIDTLKAANGALQESGLFAEHGTSRRGVGSAWEKITAKAREKMTKSATPMVLETAIARVLEEDPKLYSEYKAEQQ